MVNPEEIRQRLSEINEAIEYLGSIHRETLVARDKFLLGRYFLQTMLEALFTIGNQIISNNNYQKPAAYKDILLILAENKVIDNELCQKLLPFANLRNRLVHTYWKVSEDELLEISRDLSPFKRFLKVMVVQIK
jgi:uncharacterized protein YutE (UPF0331/DUF86 family)